MSSRLDAFVVGYTLGAVMMAAFWASHVLGWW